MSGRAVSVSTIQRIIRFLIRKGVKPDEILRRLKQPFGGGTLSRTHVFSWHKKLRKREHTKKTKHARRLETSPSTSHIQTAREPIEEERRVTLQEVGVSHGNVVLSDYEEFDEMGFQKFTTGWDNPIEISQKLLNCYKTERETFFNRILICNEIWVHYSTLPSKWSDKEWLEWWGSDEPGLAEERARLSVNKMLMTVFWDHKGIVFIDFLHSDMKADDEYYCMLLDQVEEAFKFKRESTLINKIIFLHNNAKLRMATDEMNDWIVPKYPPCCSDLLPRDPLPELVRQAMKGIRCSEDNAVVAKTLRKGLHHQPSSLFDTEIKKLPIQWHKYVADSKYTEE